MPGVATEVASPEKGILAKLLVEDVGFLSEKHRLLQALIDESRRVLLLLLRGVTLGRDNLKHGGPLDAIVFS